MHLSIDFGGSTIDVIEWNVRSVKLRSFERWPTLKDACMADILKKIPVRKYEKIFITGGKSRFFKEAAVEKVSEIEAIGRGGHYLLHHDPKLSKLSVLPSFLVVSMGTGTCMVRVQQKKGKYLASEHVGGTGVGGGTFLALAKSLLGETDLKVLKKMFKQGNKNKVDLSVKDIIGTGIGVMPEQATASNLAKLGREIDFNSFSKDDVAAGIVNLVGQTLAITAIFAAKAYGCQAVLLCGKLTTIESIVAIIHETGAFYKIPFFVPYRAEYVSAFGAGAKI